MNNTLVDASINQSSTISDDTVNLIYNVFSAEMMKTYKNVLVNDLLLDKYGQKMHKSKGNAIEPFTILKNYGADATRFYMLHTSPVWTPLKFDEDGIKEINSKFFNTLKNTYTFFQMYANADNLDPRDFNVSYDKLEEIDKWLLSKYNKLVKNVTDSFEEYDLNKAVKYLNGFVNEELSNWYIRRNRRRFWASELDNSKKAVYQTTYEVLVGLCKLAAPVVPYTTDEIYTNLTDEESVHLANYPKCDESLIDETIEKRMDLIRDLISLGRNAREESKVKVRQPISEVILDGKNKATIEDLIDLVKEELNVKEVEFSDDVKACTTYSFKPQLKTVGPKYGKFLGGVREYLANVDGNSAMDELEANGVLKFDVQGNPIELSKEDLLIEAAQVEGFASESDFGITVVLETTLSEELIEEGFVREIISKIQTMRKDSGFEVMDRIKVYVSGNDKISGIMDKNAELIKDEVLADAIAGSDYEASKEWNINGEKVSLGVEKVK